MLALAAAALIAASEGVVDFPTGLPFAPQELPALDAAERMRLVDGEVLIRDLEPTGGDGIGILTMAYIDATVEEVWEVMADCEGQDEYLPRVLHAEVRDRDGADHTCELQVDLPFPFDDPRTATRHKVRRLPDGGYQRRWTLAGDDDSYLRNRGSWTVHPFDEGSLMVNRMDLLPKTVIPTWLIQAAQSQQTPQTYQAIRDRVAAEHGRGPGARGADAPR